MLVSLHVKNLALIEEVEVEFGEGLNILTGETGAGKSILLGSMQLVLGAKASRSMIREGASFALVELLFSGLNEAARAALEALDVSIEDDQVLLSRKFSEGKSVSRINGETCTLSRMKDAAACLLDIHGQHEHQSLLYPERQLEILDAYGRGQLLELREKTAAAFGAYRDSCRQVRLLNVDEEGRAREQAFLEYEIGEISQARLVPGEDRELETQFARMTNSRTLLESVQKAASLTGAGMLEGASQSLSECSRLMQQVAALDEEAGDLSRSAMELDSLLGDFNRDLTAYMDSLSFDEETYAQTESRLDQINTLKSRFGDSIEKILEGLENRQEKLERLVNHEELCAQAHQRQQETKKELDSLCRQLSKARQDAARELEQKIIQGLKDLNFLDVRFEIRFSRKKSYSQDGFDEVLYMISTNPGESLRPLGEIVSGGELSRIMLAIKAILADRDQIQTLIFDEIDTGISGRTAQRVSEKMAVIGHHHQVLCITHLPQIAAMADRHFVIEKEAENGSTHTMIRPLDEDASVTELARLLSGSEVTEAVLENAREMKRLASEKKDAL
ncbi:MAG: DNA repair protein RecN [Blautia sp.]|nr:DNA repair protein RecN [Blautia sp.]